VNLQLLIDMNLSPRWVEYLSSNGISSVHWTDIGAYSAPDERILEWARNNNRVVFANDLDFGRLLALTHSNGPSVIQVRTQDVFPEAIGHIVLSALHDCEDMLKIGALIVIDDSTRRARILPLK